MRSHRSDAPSRDQGTALLLALVFVLVGSLVAIPVLNYAIGVSRSSRVLDRKVPNLEAAKGGLRVALADPVALYRTCDAAGLTVPVRLASPGLQIGVETVCYKLDDTTAEDPGRLPYGIAAVQVGAVVPAGTSGAVYPGSGAAPETGWVLATNPAPTVGTIWLPELPAHALNRRSPTGYQMPAAFGQCTVYFPGTYPDPLTITGPGPVYFTSGVYYFEDVVRFSGSANVVVGGGGIEGCTSDQEAAFYAISAPTTHNISGLGATFVLGDGGRIQVANDDAGSSIRVVFNRRYVDPTDISSAPSAGVSIISVNGAVVGGVAGSLNLPGVLSVPLSMVGGSPSTPATQSEYLPSTVVPSIDPLVPTVPIIDVALTTGTPVTFSVPGYVAVPQGVVNIATAVPAGMDVQLAGGVLAAQLQVIEPRPASLVVGLVNAVVQKTFKIVSTTTSDNPTVRSQAVVQVNQNGAYAINAWEVQ